MASNYTLSLTFSGKEFAYRTGVRFRGLTISQTETGYNIVIRGFTSDRAPVYSMAQHENPALGLDILLNALDGKGGARMWHKDKYYRNGSG